MPLCTIIKAFFLHYDSMADIIADDKQMACVLTYTFHSNKLYY